MNERYTLKEYLIASPYNMDTNFNGNLTESLFYKDYFIEPLVYNTLNKNMDSTLRYCTQLTKSVFLYGYSGMGKTTYLRWYIRNKINNYNRIFFDLADTICDDENSQKDSMKLFENYFYSLLCEIFFRFPDAFRELLSNFSSSLIFYFSLNDVFRYLYIL